MNSFIVPEIVVWMVLAFIFILMGSIILLIMRIMSNIKSDKVLFIDKNNRWRLENDNFAGKTKISREKAVYYLSEDGGMVNKRGKSLYVFSENKPQPMKLKYNKSQWLDSTSLKGMINNDLVQLIIKSGKKDDMLLVLGAIGGLIAGLASVIILLIQLEVI